MSSKNKIVFKNKEALIDNLIEKGAKVLDVGFWGQGLTIKNKNWPHNLILKRTNELWGLDLDYDETKLKNKGNYFRVSAESFDLNRTFDTIFAGDVIEHLSNPGLFLKSSCNHMDMTSRLIITTPNCFNLFNLIEKLFKFEPTINMDHTCYHNIRTLKTLLKKNGLTIEGIFYLYSLDCKYKESRFKKIQNLIYYLLSKLTHKYIETIVVLARKIENAERTSK